MPKTLLLVIFIAFFSNPLAHADLPAAAPGNTAVAKWKGSAKAAFLLMFDDSCPSHFQVAIPALAERKLVATFYICPGKGEYKKFADKWEKELWKSGQVYGVHTMTHQGVKDMENAEWEIGECAKTIENIGEGKKPRLISYGQPGVGEGKWNITGEQLKTLLVKYHLIDRPPFAGHGAVYHWQKTDQMLALADKAIDKGEMEYLVIHGVERITPNWGYQDFWALKQDIFFPLLDGLKERRDRNDLWVTDHISYHQYLTERKTAKVSGVQATAREISLKLTCDADPAFYDYPLTLTTAVPAAWKDCTVSQGDKQTTVTAKAGNVTYDAVPGPTPIKMRPAAK